MGVKVFLAGLKLKSRANMREHWAVRHKRDSEDKLHTFAALDGYVMPGPGLITVVLTRSGGKPMDDDNLAGAFKAVRDQVAKMLKRDDGPGSGVRWVYAQEKGPAGVRIEIHTEG